MSKKIENDDIMNINIKLDELIKSFEPPQVIKSADKKDIVQWIGSIKTSLRNIKESQDKIDDEKAKKVAKEAKERDTNQKNTAAVVVIGLIMLAAIVFYIDFVFENAFKKPFVEKIAEDETLLINPYNQVLALFPLLLFFVISMLLLMKIIRGGFFRRNHHEEKSEGYYYALHTNQFSRKTRFKRFTGVSCGIFPVWYGQCATQPGDIN